MISVDTTRRDVFARFGGAAAAPRLTALMDGGFLLADHRSCSNWTFASVLCFQGGRSDVDMGFVPAPEGGLPDAPPGLTLASEVMARAGYWSALVTANLVFSDSVATAPGFDRVILENAQDAAVVNEVALPLLNDLASRSAEESPWYLHVHYLDPHSPYSPPEEYLGGIEALPPIDFDLGTVGGHNALLDSWGGLDEAEREDVLEHLALRYAAEVDHADAQIGALLDRAEALGLTDDALVVFWTDHGEQLYEHGDLGHDRDLYDQENRAVAAFWSAHLTPGVWEGPTLHRDVWPTALKLLELEVPGSWTGALVGTRDAGQPRFALRSRGEETVQVAVLGDRKLMYWWSGERAFFHLDEDPAEQVDRYDPDDPEVIQIWDSLSDEVARVAPLVSGYSPQDPGP